MRRASSASATCSRSRRRRALRSRTACRRSPPARATRSRWPATGGCSPGAATITASSGGKRPRFRRRPWRWICPNERRPSAPACTSRWRSATAGASTRGDGTVTGRWVRQASTTAPARRSWRAWRASARSPSARHTSSRSRRMGSTGGDPTRLASSATPRKSSAVRTNYSRSGSAASMAEETNEHVTRRDFLKLGVTVGAGAIVPPMLAACGGGGDSYVPPSETFVEPLNIQSLNGVLDVTLVLSYLTTTLPNPTTPGKRDTVTLRNMYGTIPAPTLRMRVGDLLRIKVFNNLPPNPSYPPPNPVPPATIPWPQPAHLRYPNSTNLHTHGLHVYPDVYPQPYTPPGQN